MAVLSRIRSFALKSTLEILPNIYQLTIAGVNVILITEEELTLVDTGLRGSSAQIVAFIRSLGRSVEEISLIVITHNHYDHIGGLAELRRLTKAKVAAHKADIGETEGQLFYPRVIRRLLQVRPFSALRPVFSINPDDVDIRLEGSEVFKPLGGLEVIHTPGHTPGSISLFSPQNKLLIVGDALDKHGKSVLLPHKMVSNDLKQALDSVRGLSQLDFDILCFGHGRPLSGDIRARVRELAERTGDVSRARR
jgi:glyoxylase-like metal-dependent hydrolase (beta-lactamase superfamily II)